MNYGCYVLTLPSEAALFPLTPFSLLPHKGSRLKASSVFADGLLSPACFHVSFDRCVFCRFEPNDVSYTPAHGLYPPSGCSSGQLLDLWLTVGLTYGSEFPSRKLFRYLTDITGMQCRATTRFCRMFWGVSLSLNDWNFSIVAELLENISKCKCVCSIIKSCLMSTLYFELAAL